MHKFRIWHENNKKNTAFCMIYEISAERLSMEFSCGGKALTEKTANQDFIRFCLRLLTLNASKVRDYDQNSIADELGINVNTLRRYPEYLRKRFKDIGFIGDDLPDTSLFRMTGLKCENVFEKKILPQDLIWYDPEGKEHTSVTTLADDAIEACKCLYIVNSGGYGKTHFLKTILFEMNTDVQSRTTDYLSLASLLKDALSSPVSENAHCRNDMTRASDKTSYIFRHLSMRTGRRMNYNADTQYLFLLDGLNELLEQNSSHTYDTMRLIIEEIKGLAACDNVRLAVTSRRRDDILRIFPDGTGFCDAQLTGVKDQRIKPTVPLTEECARLLEKPLFFRYKETLEDTGNAGKGTPIETQYGLFEFIHSYSAMQTYKEKDLQKDEYLYLYFVVLGAIASFMETGRSREITKKQVLRLVDKIHSSAAVQERYRTMINSILKEDAKRSEIVFSKAPDFYYDDLRGLSEFVEFTGDTLHFIHDDVQEYFVCFSVISYLNSIHDTELPMLIEMTPDFNMRSSAQNAIKAELGLTEKNCSASLYATFPTYLAEKRSEEHNKTAKAIFRIFSVTEPLQPCASEDEILYHFRQQLALCLCCYRFLDHFGIGTPFDEERYQIISPFTESLLAHADFFIDRPRLLSAEENQAAAEIFAAVFQHLRLKKDYGTARKYYEFAEQRFLPDCDKLRRTLLRHHRAKIWMLNAQDIFAPGEKPVISDWFSIEEMDNKAETHSGHPDEDLRHRHGRWLFNESLKELEKCIPLNLSGNLLGHIYEKPVGWLEENDLLKRNCKKGFEYYRKTYEGMIDDHSLLQMKGTEILYTARAMMLMLYKGYVRINLSDGAISDTSGSLLNLETLAEKGVYKDSYKPDEEKPYSFTVLERLAEQEADMMPWLFGVQRALIFYTKKRQENPKDSVWKLTKKERDIVFSIFDRQNDPDNLLINATKCAILRIFKKPDGRNEKALALYNRTKAEYKKLEKDAGATIDADRTDKKYACEDAERFGIKF